MTAPMTPKQRQECSSAQQRLQNRLAELQQKRTDAEQELRQLEDDLAAEREGARTAALNRSDDLRAIDMEIHAVERAFQAEISREQADRPFVEAEAEADRRKRRASAIAVAVDKAAQVDERAREFVRAILEHQDSLGAPIALGVDPNAAKQLAAQEWFTHVLVAAGAQKYRPDLQRNPNGPNTLEEYTRQFLRA